MFTVSIAIEDPRGPEAIDLLQQSHAYLRSLYAPDECYFLDLEALCAPHISLFVAREKGTAVGCVALARYEDYGEIKSMFVDPSARGKGVGEALLRALEAHALSLGLQTLRLETGDKLYPAHRLYARLGYDTCGPFGGYQEVTTSVFMEKQLNAH